MKRLSLLILVLGLVACGALQGTTPTALPAIITAEPSPTALPTQSTSAEAVPAPTMVSPTAEPTPFQPSLTRITEPGCCIEPRWSADGQQVRFIDKPQPSFPAAIYGVGIEGGPLEIVSEQIGYFMQGGQALLYLNDEGETTVRLLESGDEWVIPNGGRAVLPSPSGEQIAWSLTSGTGGFDTRQRLVYIADRFGQNPELTITLVGGGMLGWVGEDRILLSGHEPGTPAERDLFVLSLADGSRTEIVDNQRIRTVSISPGGDWIFFIIALNPDGNTEQEGMWIVSADGQTRHRLEGVGSAQWRDDDRLVLIPLEPGAESHRLVQFNAATGQTVQLTDPAALPFKVRANNWRMAPTGDRVVFLSAADEALYVLELGEVGRAQ